MNLVLHSFANCACTCVYIRLNLPPPPILHCSPTDEYEGSRGQAIGSVSPVHDLRLLLHVGGLLCPNNGRSRENVQLCTGHHAEQINVSREASVDLHAHVLSSLAVRKW